MIKFRRFSSTESKVIKVECRDVEDNLKNLLEYLKQIGNGGHSFEIVVDPDSKDHRKKFFWDGDGSDRIFDISVEKDSEFSDSNPPEDSQARIKWAKENGVIYKGKDGWHIISLRTGKDWNAKYDTKEKAEAGLRAYQANKG